MSKIRQPRQDLDQDRSSQSNDVEVTAKQIALEALFEHLPVNFYWIDKEGYFLGCNERELHDLDISEMQGLVGKHANDILAKEAWENSQEVIRNKKSISYEEKHLEKDIYYLSVKSPLINKEKEVIGVVGISVDITDLKNTQNALIEQMQKTKEAYQAKAQLLSTTAHEIRGPIGNVGAMLKMQGDAMSVLKEFFYEEILSEVPADKREALIEKFHEKFAKVYEYADIAKSQITRGLHALSNLRELHMLQLEGVKPSYCTAEIPSLIHEAIQNSKFPNHHHIEFRQKIDRSLPDVIILDYYNIYEALRVIIGNAIRFSHPDSIVKISVENADDQKIKIIVEDFGVGLAESQIKTLFNPGFGKDLILEEMRYQKPSLQLPQVKMRVEASGGNIEIQSQCHYGTKVILTIPYQDIPDDADISTDRIPPQYYLLVEDDPLTQKITRDLLVDDKHRVDMATSAEDALNFTLKNTYDAILLDITLPDKNGLTVMREVLKDKPNFPVVILTAHDSEVDQEYFLSQGAANVLSKPITLENLRNCLAVVYRM